MLRYFSYAGRKAHISDDDDTLAAITRASLAAFTPQWPLFSSRHCESFFQSFLRTLPPYLHFIFSFYIELLCTTMQQPLEGAVIIR